MNFKSFLSENSKDYASLLEGTMSDIHQLAGESKDIESFTKDFFKQFGAKIKKTADSVEWVESLYTDMTNEAYDGNMADFKYEFPMKFEEATGNPVKAIKKMAKKGKNGYEVRTSTYMSEPEMKLVADAMGMELKSYLKSTNIAISVFESVVTEARYNKKSLLKKLGDADDATIQTGNGKEYIIYNPDSNNDDNAAMWNDNSVFAVDQDGEEHEIAYKDIGLVMVESLVNEAKVTLKRRYTENHPAKTVGKFAKVRNKVLEAIADGTITQEEFDNILSELSNNAKRWSKNNSKYFTISEEGISLSKFGKRVLNSITVNEATEVNPEIWVPAGFDKAIAKLPNSQITRDVVLKVAKKHKVNPDEAIAYVEYGWMLDLNENTNTNMKTQFIYESFSEFVNSLDESTVNEGSELNEAFKSSKLRNLMNMDQASAYGKNKNFPSAFYGMSKVKLDQVGDESLVDVDPKTAYKQYANNRDFVVFYIVDNEKENIYADRDGRYSLKPGILALSRAKDFLSVSYDQRRSKNSKNAKYTLGKDDGSAVGGNKNYKGYGATGISSIKRAAELADRAIVFNLVAGSPSSVDDIEARIKAKEGAIAFKSHVDFKRANIQRYQEILAAKASKLPLDKMVEDAINQLTSQMQAGIKSGEKTQYGEIKVGQNSKGRDVKVTDVANHMNSILRDYERYVSYIAQAEKDKKDGYSTGYYERESQNYAKSLKDNVKKIKKFDYAW